MKFHPQWDVPDGDQVLSYIRENYPDEAEKLSLERAVEFAALYSHSILGEDPEDAKIEGLSPELLNIVNRLDIKGNPMERGMKATKLMQEEGDSRMQQILNAYGEKAAEGILEQSLETIEEEWESGRGGESHKGEWFGGMEINTPISVSPNEKVKIMELARKLKTFRSFNLQTKRSNKISQDDWGENEQNEIGLPEDIFKTDTVDLADTDLFDYLFMIKSLRYFENYSRKVLPNNWLLLIDDSGSMNSRQKLSWILALLSIITEDVLKNKSIAYVGMFEAQLSPFWKLDSLESIQAFMTRFRGGHGGDTDIQGALTDVAHQLESGSLRSWDGPPHQVSDSLEIFIVNDGQDHVTSNFTPPAKTHSLMLYQDKESEYAVNLANAVKRSGGAAHLVDQKGFYTL